MLGDVLGACLCFCLIVLFVCCPGFLSVCLDILPLCFMYSRTGMLVKETLDDCCVLYNIVPFLSLCWSI